MIGHKISGSPVVLNFQGLMMGGLVAPVADKPAVAAEQKIASPKEGPRLVEGLKA